MSRALHGYFVIYMIHSRDGKEMVAHHENIKPRVLPTREGILHCPAPENTAMHLVLGGPPLWEV